MNLLRVESLSVDFGRRTVLSDVDLTVGAGEILGLIGETGSGKTTFARAVAGLAPVSSGRITVDGIHVTALRGRKLREFRRTGAVQLMFQDPLRALDPQQTVAAIVGEGLWIGSEPLTAAAISARVSEALRAAGLDDDVLGRRPGRISGGQRQRVLLARAIAVRPRLLLADEPVSALDASNRNHVLRLLDELRVMTDLAIVVISHDLSSLVGIADRVAVLYGGRVVEHGPVRDVLHDPAHPYTALLTASAPSMRRTRRMNPADLRPTAVPAFVTTAGSGCPYSGRCRFATDRCAVEPPLLERPDARAVACHHVDTWPNAANHLDPPTARLEGTSHVR